jgi:hypothetical protein
MDVQQLIALAIVAAAAALLVLRYARGRRKPKFRECADCAAASMHAPAIHSVGPGDKRGEEPGGGAAK